MGKNGSGRERRCGARLRQKWSVNGKRTASSEKSHEASKRFKSKVSAQLIHVVARTTPKRNWSSLGDLATLKVPYSTVTNAKNKTKKYPHTVAKAREDLQDKKRAREKEAAKEAQEATEKLIRAPSMQRIMNAEAEASRLEKMDSFDKLMERVSKEQGDNGWRNWDL